MLKFKLTVNMLICKESVSCCPLIHNITMYVTINLLTTPGGWTWQTACSSVYIMLMKSIMSRQEVD